MLTWESPPSHHEGGKVWKLDGSRSNANQLRWVCEEGGLGNVFFWRRVPDIPVRDSPCHDNNVSCWHAIDQACRKVLFWQGGCHADKAQKNADSRGPCKFSSVQSHTSLPNLMGSNRLRKTKASVDQNQTSSSKNMGGSKKE